MEFPSVKTTAPVESLLTLTRAALGLGLGLLVAGKIKESVRNRTAIALLGVGAVSAIPYIYELISKQINRPESERSMNRQLRSIRNDPGLESAYEVV